MKTPKLAIRRRATAAQLDQAMMDMISERDIEGAHQRVGRTTDERLRWVIRFADLNLEQLSTGEWLTLGAEAAAWVAADEAPKVRSRVFTLNATLLREAHGLVRAMLDDLAAHKRVELPASREALVSRGDERGDPDRMRVTRFQRERGLPLIMPSIAARLIESCPRLRRCPECGRPFVAQRRQRRHAECAWQARARTRQAKRDKQRKRPKKGAS